MSCQRYHYIVRPTTMKNEVKIQMCYNVFVLWVVLLLANYYGLRIREELQRCYNLYDML